MATYYPVFVTAALFIAIVLEDLILHSPENITKHSLEGLVCVLLMLILSRNNMEYVSWGLLVLPLVVIIVCGHYAYVKGPSVVSANILPIEPVPMMSSPISASGSPSSISVPASPTMSAMIGAKDPPTFTPITKCAT